MAIAKGVRDRLLVEARHRCTICSEKCFEIHHIVEQAQGGTDDTDNLIVLCPNCHQHRYHRSSEFTPDQLRMYQTRLREANEVERRVLQNLDEIRQLLPQLGPDEVEARLKTELQESLPLVTPERAPALQASLQTTCEWLAERDLMRGGARRAIEIEWEATKEREKRRFPEIKIQEVDQDAFRKAPDFPAAYYLEFVLDHTPNPDWVEVFMTEYHMSFYGMKRKTRVSGDRISMVVSDKDNLQGHADFAKGLVNRTNDRIRTAGFQQIDHVLEQRKQEALRQFDAIQTMKARTKDIKI